jgi:hypothetical protein
VSDASQAGRIRPAIAGSPLASGAVVARVTPSAIPCRYPFARGAFDSDRTRAPAASPTLRRRPDPAGRNRPHGRSVFFNKINFRFLADSAATIFLGLAVARGQ